jgi:hypothetical protein
VPFEPVGAGASPIRTDPRPSKPKRGPRAQVYEERFSPSQTAGPTAGMRKERSFPDGVISETAKAGFALTVAGVIEVERQFENMPAGRIEPSASRRRVSF